MENMIPTVAAAAVGMAIGGAAVYAATQDHRQIRRTVHRLSRGAEKALIDFDRMVESYTKYKNAPRMMAVHYIKSKQNAATEPHAPLRQTQTPLF